MNKLQKNIVFILLICMGHVAYSQVNCGQGDQEKPGGGGNGSGESSTPGGGVNIPSVNPVDPNEIIGT